MEWLVIAALAVWIWLQSRRVEELSRRVRELGAELGLEPGAAASRPAAHPAPPRADERGELLLDTPLPPDSREPLLLDTPLPPPSNDVGEIEVEEEDEPLDLAQLAPVREPMPEPERAAPPAPPPRAPRRSFEKWIAETALAWLGGAAVAAALAALVAVAVQQEFFTPPVRLFSGVIVGLITLAFSEWVRRGGIRAKGFEHPLAAALLAGAGVAAFYIVTWAAHGLYAFIDWREAAGLLALCALLLLALSLIHGQALGVLAVVAAMLAPPLTHIDGWSAGAITLYITAVVLAAFALAAQRRWISVAGSAIAGLYVWFAAAISADDTVRAFVFLSLASLGGVAMGLRRPSRTDPSWDEVSPLLPAIAISIGSVLMLWTWLSIAAAPKPALVGSMLAGLLQVGLAAGAVRRRIAHPAAFATAAGALAFGALIFSASRERYGPIGDFYVWALAVAPFVGPAALVARPNRHGRALVAAGGAGAAALLVILAVFARDAWNTPAVWAPLFFGAVLLTAAAYIAARYTATPEKDWAVDLWAAAATVLLLLGMESLSLAHLLPTALAGASLLLALGFSSRGWRALSWGALTAAALSLAHALSSDFTGAALVGATPIGTTLAVLLSAAGFQFTAARAASKRARDTGEALSAAGVLLLLLAAFHGLRWIAAGGAGMPLDGFTESALNALTLMAAGYIVLPRERQQLGVIGRVRGHVLMGAGLLFALMQLGLFTNPWWGDRPASPLGPSIFNAQALAYLAPAALAFAASARLYGRQLLAGRIYAIAGGLFAAMWVLLEIRRAFHGALSASAEVGVFEAHCYGLAALAGALAIAVSARLRDAKDAERPFTHDLSRASRALAVAGIVIAGLIMLLMRHPWWGAQNGADSGELSASLSVLAQAVAVALCLFLGRALSRGDGVERSRFAAAAAAAVFGWSFGHAAIRWLHHRAAMDDGAALSGLEGFGHALWPLVFVLAGSALTARAPGRDTVRAYLYDLEALWSSAIWPALAWCAFGLWFVFNPWIGFAPASATSPLAAGVGLATLLLAAWFSAFSPQTPHIRFRAQFEIAARVACVGHLFTALSLAIRRLYQGPDMRAALEAGSLETWTYSAVWALFGAAVFGVGLMRKDATLRWCGLVTLLFVTAKVFVFDTARLDGVIRFGSLFALGVVLFASTLAARRFNRAPQGSREV